MRSDSGLEVPNAVLKVGTEALSEEADEMLLGLFGAAAAGGAGSQHPLATAYGHSRWPVGNAPVSMVGADVYPGRVWEKNYLVRA